jgi:hypothetical protein
MDNEKIRTVETARQHLTIGRRWEFAEITVRRSNKWR